MDEMQFQRLITIVAALILLVQPTRANLIEDLINPVRDERQYDKEHMNFFDWLLQDVLPLLIGQRPNNENGTMHQYAEYALTDESNDDAAYLSGVSNVLSR